MNNTQVSAIGVSAAPREQAGARSVAIAMYCVLLLSYVLMAADRYLFPVLAIDVRQEFGFSLANLSLLSTIFTLGLGVGGLSTGYLLSRLPRKAVLLTGITIFSSATALTTVCNGFWRMFLCLAAQGLGMAMLATAMFALAANYFARYRAAAIGSVNFCYGLGGYFGPKVAARLRVSYMTWHAPMIAFGMFGLLMVVVIAITVKRWFSEAKHAAEARAEGQGASTLLNRNTTILTILSVIHGLSMYGFLGMYPTFLRGDLHYSPQLAASVISFFGLGALLSMPGGLLGDRFSPRVVLSGSYICIAILGYFFFQQAASALTREILTFTYGVVGSSVLYVNLAGYHVKALRATFASKGSGMFVTSLYGSAAFSGYLIGALTSRLGWLMAAEIQMSLLCAIGAVLALALQPREMAA